MADATAVARYFGSTRAPTNCTARTIPYTPGYAVMSFYGRTVSPEDTSSVELPDANIRAFGGWCARRQQCMRGGRRGRLPVAVASPKSWRLMRRFPDGALNICHRLWPRSRAGATDAAGIDHISFTGSARVGTLICCTKCRPRRHVPVLRWSWAARSPQNRVLQTPISTTLPVIGCHLSERRTDLQRRLASAG